MLTPIQISNFPIQNQLAPARLLSSAFRRSRSRAPRFWHSNWQAVMLHSQPYLRAVRPTTTASTVHMLRYNHQGVVSMQLRADRLEHVPDREQLKLIQPRIWLSANDDTQISAVEGMTSDDGETASLTIYSDCSKKPEAPSSIYSQ
jgi:hypothetical protein